MVDDKVKGPRREAMFQALNDGQLRVAIGTRERMGIGVNAQDHNVAILQIDVPWRPMDLEQSNGRGLRQRANPEINEMEILYFGVVGTLDSAQYDVIATKAKMIAQILKGNWPEGEEDPFDDAIMSYEQQMAAFSGNPKAILKIGLENDIRALEAARTGHFQEIRTAKRNLAETEKEIVEAQKRIVETEGKVKEFDAAFPPAVDPFVEITGKMIAGRKEVVAALDDYLKRKIEDAQKIAEQKSMTGEIESTQFSEIQINGKPVMMKIYLVRQGTKDASVAFLESYVKWHLAGANLKEGKATTGQGMLHGLAAQLEAIRRQPQQEKDRLASLQRNHRNLAGFIDQPFQQEADLMDKKARLAALIQELTAEGSPVVSPQVIEANEIGVGSDPAGEAEGLLEEKQEQ